MMVWHYTVGAYARQILDSGILLPAYDCALPSEEAILWFSSNQIYEQTANKGIRVAWEEKWGSTQETCEAGGGIFRFGVPVERTIKWPEVGKRAGIRADPGRKELMRYGRKKGADPREWYGIIGSIPFDETVRFQVWIDFRVWANADRARVEREIDARLRIEIPQLDLAELTGLALENYRLRGGAANDAEHEDPRFLDRIRVNYIRHELTDYDERIDRAHQLPGMDGVVGMIRRKFYHSIAKVYPQLVEECQRQCQSRV